MKCPKCQSTKLLTGNAGLLTLIPFLYCPVCRVEGVADEDEIADKYVSKIDWDEHLFG